MPLISVFCEEISAPDWKEKRGVPASNFLDVWRVPLSLPGHLLETLKCLLTDEEIQQTERYLHKEDRIRHLLGKGFLRKVLQVYLNEDQKRIHFGKNQYNKPFLIGRDNFHFNISHSGNWVVIALADREVGIDIEQLDSSFEYKDLLSGFFSASEAEFVETSHHPIHSFYKIWTRKEALLKGIGQGITDQLSDYCLLDGLQRFNLSGTDAPWNVRSAIIDSDHCLSLAQPSPGQGPQFFNWRALLSD